MLEELLKLKKSLKQWETDFYKQHGKKPGKVLPGKLIDKNPLKIHKEKYFSQNFGKCASRVKNSGERSRAIITLLQGSTWALTVGRSDAAAGKLGRSDSQRGRSYSAK